MTLGERLKISRKKKELSLAKVGEHTGVTQSYLSKIERGTRQPSLDLLHDLSKLYEVDLKWLIEGFQQETNNESLLLKRKKEELVELINKINISEDIDKLTLIVRAFIKEGRD